MKKGGLCFFGLLSTSTESAHLDAKLNTITTKDLPSSVPNAIKNVVAKYPKVFEKPGLPPDRPIEHTIELTNPK